MRFELENTRIAVRERNLREVLDLSLHVFARNFGPVMLAIVAGALPFALANAWLLRKLLDDSEFTASEWEYAMWLGLLVFLQLPLASSVATVYLGQAMFVEKPSWRRVWHDTLACWRQLFWTQGVLRGVVPGMLFVLMSSGSDETGAGHVFLAMIAIYVALVRAARPFINEVVLLERNPQRAASPGGMTTGLRSTNLHEGSLAELFGHWLTAAAVAVLGTISLWLALWYLRLQLVGNGAFDRPAFEIWLPVAMWILGGYMVVVRYLSYLDLRIRREGWELELRMRTEAAKIAEQLT
jgi:hypothetical protein